MMDRIFLGTLLCLTLTNGEAPNQIAGGAEFVLLHQFTSNLKMLLSEKQVHKTNLYDKSQAVPVDIDIHYGIGGHRTFLTVPRFSFGIPYSLAMIIERENYKEVNPSTIPYPNLQWHSGHGLNCSLISSAIRTFIDSCSRLWVIDSGQISSMQYCPPQLLAFDLNSNNLVHRHTFASSLYKPGLSVFSALTVDVEENSNCLNSHSYIADTWGYGLIIINSNGQAWRIEHELMQPDGDLKKLNAAIDGIFTVNISPKSRNQERQLYFHALNSFIEVSVPLAIVNNASFWTTSREGINKFRIIGSRRIQCESEAMDNNGNLFCSVMKLNALIKWKEGTIYNADNISVVAHNSTQFNYVTGLKVIQNNAGGDEIWALSNNPVFFAGSWAFRGRQLAALQDVKFQILGCRVKDLLFRNLCNVELKNFNKFL